jgi:hypothetical protein
MRTERRHQRLTRTLPPLLLVLAACAPTPTATVQLVLSTTPDLCRTEDLLAQVATVTVVVSALGGLAGVSAPGPTAGGGTAVDFDGDGVLEVVFQTPLAGPELPILELGLPHNAGRDLTFRVLGFGAGVAPAPQSAVAVGGVSARVAAGEVRKVGTPFNLLAAARPPRVVLCLPPDGTPAVPLNLAAITLMFSTTVDEATAVAAARVVAPDGQTLPTVATLETLSYAAAGGTTERRSLLTLALAGALTEPGDYVIEVAPGVVSTAGRRFDQDPSTPAEDGFVSRFQIGSGVGGGGHPCELCTTGYVCNDTGTGCLPVLDCAAGCGAGFVCDPAPGFCVEDCRGYGACVDPAATCDAATGRCG